MRFLKFGIVLIAVVVLFAMIRFPQTEGRAAKLDLIGIYSDPLIIYVYIASIPFFIGLYQAFRLLNFIEAGKVFSHEAKRTLKKIQYCSISLIISIVLALFYIRFFVHGEDSAGPAMLGIIAIVMFGAIGLVAIAFQVRK